MSPRAQKLLRRTLVGGGLVGGLVWLLSSVVDANGAPRLFLVEGIVLSFALLGTFETVRMGPRGEARPLSLLGAFLVSALVGHELITWPDWSALSRFSMVLAAGGLAALALAPGQALRAHLLRAIWLTPPLLAVLFLFEERGRAGLISLLVLSKIGDIAGYYLGSLLGKRHPFPNISPGKTLAGCVGSLAAGTLAGLLLEAFEQLPAFPLGLLGGALFGALINLAAQAGDLLESLLKRRAGVKDSGRLFGPSGGVLDLIDSLLLTAPVFLLIAPWLLPQPPAQ